MATIGISGPLRPTTTNTPCDERTRVATEGDILNIEMPFVGMIVYCIANGKYYKITSLKSKTIGGIEIPDRLVDDYEEFGASVSIDGYTIIDKGGSIGVNFGDGLDADDNAGLNVVPGDGITVDENGVSVKVDNDTLTVGLTGLLQLNPEIKSTIEDLASFVDDAYDFLDSAISGTSPNT